MATYCDNCDEEINNGEGKYRFGEYNLICLDCYTDFRSTHFECDECGSAIGIDAMVEDVAYSNTEHSTCHSCFIHRELKLLPPPICDCGKPCLKKTLIELEVQLEKKTEVYQDACPTKHSFHKDYCKICDFTAQLASRAVTYDNQRVGFLMRLKLGNDPSALINRFLGGTAVSKLLRTKMDYYGGGTLLNIFLNQSVRKLRFNDDEDAPSLISYLSAMTARYEMRNRYKHTDYSNHWSAALFGMRLELLNE